MTYSEYIKFYKETIRKENPFQDGFYIVNKDNNQKIKTDGSLNYYDGDTIIFDLPSNLKDECYRLQTILYEKLSQVLSVKLSKKLLHMTAHQLYNPYYMDFGKLKDEEKLEKMNKNYNEFIDIMGKYDRNLKIKVKIFSVYCGNSRDVTVMLLPVDEENYNLLKSLYDDFEQILPFGKDMGYMHVTLAYYKPVERIDKENTLKIEEYMNTIKFSDDVFEISLKDLNYVRYTNMDNYHTI